MYTPAQKLKQEADNLFRQQKYESAALKYGQAIKLDGKNPILFANRALCRLRMKQVRSYMDAGSDASNALRLDPSYAKAHARYAEAHEAMGLCMHAEVGWRRALQALPEHHLTPTELELKGTFDRSHTEALPKIQS
ncbi:hypothetical protein MPER_01649 [Moniliophthora perniciosa FA553]|nr:hypothetical protein MPER_01649 [Moniliophthora perniciosa FA553]